MLLPRPWPSARLNAVLECGLETAVSGSQVASPSVCRPSSCHSTAYFAAPPSPPSRVYHSAFFPASHRWGQPLGWRAKTMIDPRYTKLARLLVEYSTALRRGDRVLI